MRGGVGEAATRVRVLSVVCMFINSPSDNSFSSFSDMRPPDLGRSGSTHASLLGSHSLPAELLPTVAKTIISPGHLLLRGITKIKGLQVQ